MDTVQTNAEDVPALEERGRSAGWRCRVSLSQLCQEGPDVEGRTGERTGKYMATLSHAQAFTRSLASVRADQRPESASRSRQTYTNRDGLTLLNYQK